MKLLKNLLYLFGAETASKVITFVVITYLARVAGPEGFGDVEFAAAVLLCAGLIVDQGFGTYGAREIARAPERTMALVFQIVSLRLVLSVVAFAGMVGFTLLLHRSEAVTRLLLLYALSLLVSPLLLPWVFQGHNRMGPVAAIQVARQGVWALVVLAFVRSVDRIWFAAVGEFAGAVCAVILGIWLCRRQFGFGMRISLGLSSHLLREGMPIGLSQLFWMIRMFGATVIIGIVAVPEDVGFFGGAMRILIALHTFIFLYYFNLLPSMSRAWQESRKEFARLVANSLHLVAWVCLFVGVVWVVVAPLVTMVVYGTAFAPTIGPLQWLAGVWAVAAISGHYRFGLIAAGQQAAEMIIAATAAGVALVVLPVGYAAAGPSGATMGLLASEIVVWLSAWWWSQRQLGLKGHGAQLIRPALSSLLVLAGLRLWPSAPVGLQLVFVVAVIGTIALGCDSTLRNFCWQITFLRRPDPAGPIDSTVRPATTDPARIGG